MDISKLNIDDLCGYESPITMAVRYHVDKMMEEGDNGIVARISQEMALDINKDELLKALQYDRDQYSKGYRDGYNAGYDQATKDTVENIKKFLGIESPSEHQEQQFKVTFDNKSAAEWFVHDMCTHCKHFSDDSCCGLGDRCSNFNKWEYKENENT